MKTLNKVLQILANTLQHAAESEVVIQDAFEENRPDRHDIAQAIIDDIKIKLRTSADGLAQGIHQLGWSDTSLAVGQMVCIGLSEAFEEARIERAVDLRIKQHTPWEFMNILNQATKEKIIEVTRTHFNGSWEQFATETLVSKKPGEDDSFNPDQLVSMGFNIQMIDGLIQALRNMYLIEGQITDSPDHLERYANILINQPELIATISKYFRCDLYDRIDHEQQSPSSQPT